MLLVFVFFFSLTNISFKKIEKKKAFFFIKKEKNNKFMTV